MPTANVPVERLRPIRPPETSGGIVSWPIVICQLHLCVSTVKQIPFREYTKLFHFNRRTIREIKQQNISALGEGHTQTACQKQLKPFHGCFSVFILVFHFKYATSDILLQFYFSFISFVRTPLCEPRWRSAPSTCSLVNVVFDAIAVRKLE